MPGDKTDGKERTNAGHFAHNSINCLMIYPKYFSL
jgi:hypothetical protein